ncbi:MAG: 5-formyltetrahydrofolate cyclo-ligase [Treponema sp.]|nr:5-formyltetrahydrofolate cyclo-ligase [Treponema sp.]
MRERLNLCRPGEFRSQGQKAAALLSASSIWEQYQRVSVFLSMKKEIHTQYILEASRKAGKKVLVPEVQGDTMIFTPLNPEDGEDTGAEPLLLICPGLAFDLQGGRLGRGRGYYDRYLSSLSLTGRPYLALGLCMDFQLADSIPMEEHDIPMGALLTGTGLYLGLGVK